MSPKTGKEIEFIVLTRRLRRDRYDKFIEYFLALQLVREDR